MVGTNTPDDDSWDCLGCYRKTSSERDFGGDEGALCYWCYVGVTSEEERQEILTELWVQQKAKTCGQCRELCYSKKIVRFDGTDYCPGCYQHLTTRTGKRRRR